MKTLTYTHRFASGRVLTLTVTRHANTRPIVTSDLDCRNMTADELAEYLPWRNQTVASLMCQLTPGEVFACNK